MTASLRRACAAVGAPLGLVLEGGYSLGALTGSVAALMPVLVAESRRRRRRTPCRCTGWRCEAAERLSPWWPAPGSARRRRGARRRRRRGPSPAAWAAFRSRRTGRRTRPSSPVAQRREVVEWRTPTRRALAGELLAFFCGRGARGARGDDHRPRRLAARPVGECRSCRRWRRRRAWAVGRSGSRSRRRPGSAWASAASGVGVAAAAPRRRAADGVARRAGGACATGCGSPVSSTSASTTPPRAAPARRRRGPPARRQPRRGGDRASRPPAPQFRHHS